MGDPLIVILDFGGLHALNSSRQPVSPHEVTELAAFGRQEWNLVSIQSFGKVGWAVCGSEIPFLEDQADDIPRIGFAVVPSEYICIREVISRTLDPSLGLACCKAGLGHALGR